MRILIASPIYPAAINELRKNHDAVCAFDASENKLKSLVHDREVIVFRSGVSITAEVMGNAPNLELLIRAGSGMDNLDVDYVKKCGFSLIRIPEPSAIAVAEMAFALMLSLSRNILQADRLLREGHWAKHEFIGFLLTGKVLGIIGTGNIGKQVGKLGSAWEMKVIGCDKEPSEEFVDELTNFGIKCVAFSEVIARADYLTIHVPLNKSTRNMIDAKVLSIMKTGSYLINLSRGGVVDEQALYFALNNGKRLRGAALDVHQEEGEGKVSLLASLPNVILTPHIGSQTYDTQKEMGERILRILESFEKNKKRAESLAKSQRGIS